MNFTKKLKHYSSCENMNNKEELNSPQKKESAFEARRAARSILVRMLYEWSAGSDSAQDVFELRSHQAYDSDYTYLKNGFFAIVERVDDFDAAIKTYLDRDIKRLGLIELSILRIATYELSDMLEVPYKVVLNEEIELTKMYGSQDSHKFVNAIVDKLSKELRQAER